MERIAPLAKILAEANGIEWEHLHGTGPSGQIVEQDILDYLTRVMSGEAEPPSTPVDAPPPDWDGNDVPGAGMFDAAALSKAGVESDIAEFVSQGRPAGDAQIPGVHAPALETSDFELEEESAPVAAAPVMEAPAPAPTPAPVVETPSVEAAPVAAAAATTAAAGGLGSLLSRLYHKDDVAAAPVTEPEPVHVPEVVEAPAPVVETPVVETPRVEVAPVVEAPAPIVEPEPVHVPEVVKAPEPEPVHVEPAPVAAPAPVVEVPAPAVQPAAVFVDEEVHAPVTEAAPVVAPVAAPVATPAPAAPVAPAATASTPVYSGPTSEVPRDAVWFGTYMRRNASVGTLTDLQGQLRDALERDVPLALLVARAAGRHLDTLGLQNVAMQDVNAAQARSIGNHSGSLRDGLTALDSNYDGTPDLLIVDAGSLGLDDLHYPHTLTLSVGRVADGQASLSLQGDVEAAKAAAFLSKVADTLEKPVILLV